MDLSTQESYVKVSFSSLIEEKIVPPSFQRLLTASHVESIFKGIKNSLDKKLKPLLPGCLIICETADGHHKWLIDGNHRFEAYKRILNEMKEDLKVVVNYISVPDRQAAEELFRIVNHSVPVPEMPDGVSLDMPNKLYKAVLAKYPNIFSESKRCQRPKICRDLFIEALGQLVAKVPNVTPVDFVARLEKYNNILKRKNWREFISKPGDTQDRISSLQEKCVRYGGIFVGLKPDFQWMMYIYGDAQEDLKGGVRPKITAVLRKAVFEKYQKDHLVKCVHCKKDLGFPDFECGHIISVAKGGTTTLQNLVPVCGFCNRSVGDQNVNEFNLKHGL